MKKALSQKEKSLIEENKNWHEAYEELEKQLYTLRSARDLLQARFKNAEQERRKLSSALCIAVEAWNNK